MSREILIVEDEALIALSLKEQIEGFGYLVSDIVDTGESVIDSVIREKPDLILMDINLKGSMDGIEAASTVTKKFDIPIIFLTSYSNKEVIERAKKIAPYGYIIKSIEESNLQISIDVALNKHYFNQKFKLKKEIELKSISHTATKHKQEIDQFTYNVSHALLGPVKSMQGLVNLMFTENEINPESKFYLNQIDCMIKRLNTTMNDIVKYSINSNTEPVNSCSNLEGVINEAIINLKNIENWNDISFSVTVQQDAENSFDKERLLMILQSIIDNSIKYADKSKTKMYVKISAITTKERIMLSITDNGVGIPHEIHGRVFDLFFKGTINSKGSGMGLYLVKEAVETLKGSVHLESQPEKGTTIIITL